MGTATPSHEPRVTIAELSTVILDGRVTGSMDEFIEYAFGKDRGVVGPDWAGRPSVPIKVAAELVGAHVRGKAEAARLREGYALYLGERNAARDDATRKAFEVEARARKLDRLPDLRAPGVPLGTPEAPNSPARAFRRQFPSIEEQEAQRIALEAARAAAEEARQRFDSRVPELDFQTWVQKNGRKAAA